MNVVITVTGADDPSVLDADDAPAPDADDPSTITGDTTGAVVEDDPGNDTASGALSISDPDEGDNPTIAAQDHPGTYGALAVLDGGAWTYTLDNDDPETNALGGGETVTDTFTVAAAAADGNKVNVVITVAGADDPPAANAGEPRNVDGGEEVALDGSGSSDPEGRTFTYAWTQTGGTAVTLTGADTATPSFTAPAVPGTLTFSLTVSDGTHGSAATVEIAVSPLAAAQDETDYDSDDDNLIDISTLAQLDAVRWDLTGDGAVDDASDPTVEGTDAALYAAAFPGAAPGMGCPDTCRGYELKASLDFDPDGDGHQDGDAYWNSGAGWLPIGDTTTGFSGFFKANGHTIKNLFIDRSTTDLFLDATLAHYSAVLNRQKMFWLGLTLLRPRRDVILSRLDVPLIRLNRRLRPSPSAPRPQWAKLTSLRAAAAPRIGLATLVMFLVLACEPPSPSDITFERWHNGNSEIYGMSADGSGQTRLTDNPVLDGSPSWSPDGGRIAFESLRDGNGEIYVMNADGSGQTRLTDNPGFDGSPSWSPDGSRIAFQSFRDGDANPDIYVMNADGSGQTRLTDDPVLSGSPSWSPDGGRIAFESLRDGNPDIYVMNADGSGQTPLTDDPEYDGSPSWSPDGGRIAFESLRDGNPDIYVMNADGSGQTRLTDAPGFDGSPSWSPDGSRIAFESLRDENPEIYVMNADGSGQTRLTSNPAADGSPSWSPQSVPGSRATPAP